MRAIFLHFPDNEYILKQAEVLEFIKEREPTDKAGYEEKYYKQWEYLPKIIIESEKRKPFMYKEKEFYGDEKKLITDAERASILKFILDDIR